MSNTIQLNCLVYDEPKEKAFGINIEIDNSIILLKEKIKEYRLALFAEVDAPDIELWKLKIPIPFGDDIMEDDPFQYENEKLINSFEKINDIFTEPLDDEYIHIIVECPLRK